LQTAIAAVALTFSGTFAGFAPSSLAAAATSGQIVTFALGKQPSLQAAAVAMLSRIHQSFGARPTVEQVAQNTSAHSVTLFFTDTRNGQQFSGMSIVSAAPGSEASGAALYDTTARFPVTIKAMLQRYGTMKVPAAQTVAAQKVALPPLAPPEPLIVHQFSDGTGSMGVPADWTLRGGGGGSAVAVGPTGKEIVNFNFTQPALVPSSVMGQMLLNGTGIYPNGPLRENGLKSIVLMPYTGDPVEAWSKSWGLMAKQAGRNIAPAFNLGKVTRTGPRTAVVSGTGVYGGTSRAFVYLAYLNITPPSRLGQWAMYFDYVIVPKDEIVKEGATASAVLASVQIDFAVLNGHIDEQRKADQRRFESEIANQQALDAARQEGTDAFIARDQANADAAQGQAVAMEHYVLGTSVVSVNGVHSQPIDSDLAAALVQANPHYQIVRPSELIKGVDY
jgi:hypothetical protein